MVKWQIIKKIQIFLNYTPGIDIIREVLTEKAIEIENKVHNAFLKWYNNKKKKNMNKILIHAKQKELLIIIEHLI